MSFYYSLCVCFCLLVGNGIAFASEYVNISKNVLSRNDVLDACRIGNVNTRMLSELDLRNSDLRHQLISGLEVGAEAWVSDLAKFSDFAVNLGCWEKYVKDTDFTTNNVYECSKFCKTQFIGLNENECHCIIRKPEQSLKIRASSCTVTCRESLFGEACGGRNAITLYEMLYDTYFDPTLNKNEYKQCVILNTLPDSSGIVWTTESCFAVCDDCKPLCTRCSDSSVFTVPDIPQGGISWTQAQDTCKMKNYCPVVNLTTADVATLTGYLNPLHRYWTGLFRTFNVIRTGPQSANSSSVCLFVRKNHTSLEFDTASCSDKKQLVCLKQRLPSTTPKKTTTSTREDEPSTETPTTTTSAPEAPISTQEPTILKTGTTQNQSFAGQFTMPPTSKGEISYMWKIVIATVSAVAALVIVVATTVIYRKKTVTKQKADINYACPVSGDSANLAESNLADQANQQNVNLYTEPSVHYYSLALSETDQEYAELADDETNYDTCGINKPLSDTITGNISPRKPMRRTLKMKQTRTEDLCVSDNQQENTYDVVNEIKNPSPDQETCYLTVI